jgi:hypothetical protein
MQGHNKDLFLGGVIFFSQIIHLYVTNTYQKEILNYIANLLSILHFKFFNLLIKVKKLILSKHIVIILKRRGFARGL